jgi:hypothetical protein
MGNGIESFSESAPQPSGNRAIVDTQSREGVAGREAPEAKWPQPPRLWTRRNLAIASTVMVLSGLLAVLAIYLRRTRTEETSARWGAASVVAMQAAPQLWIAWLDDRKPDLGMTAADCGPMDVSSVPNLGHLRHALADDRSYDWSAGAASQDDLQRTDKPEWILIDLRGEPLPPVTARLELTSGRVQLGDSGQYWRLTDRVQPAVAAFLRQLRKVRIAIEQADKRRAELETGA